MMNATATKATWQSLLLKMSEAADSESCLTLTSAYRELPLLADRVPAGK